MAQEINEQGIIEKVVQRNVVFNRRIIKKIEVIEGDKVNVEVVMVSVEGSLGKSIDIPFKKIKDLEELLWELIDSEVEGSA